MDQYGALYLHYVVRKIADHFARQGGGGGGFMGWVIRDPRIIWFWGRGGVLDPRGSVIRGPPTTHDTYKANSRHATLSSHHIMAPLCDSPQSIPGVGNIHTLCTRTGCYPYHIVHTDPVCSPQWVNVSHSPQFVGLGTCTASTATANQTLFHLAEMKWETTGVAADWCDCRLLTGPVYKGCADW